MNYKRWSRSAYALLIAIAVLGGTGSGARAIVGAPEPINMPLPEEWREPVRRFLFQWGVKDVDAVLAVTKFREIGGYSKSIVLRLEHQAFCNQGLCMTAIGEIKNANFDLNVIFPAGGVIGFEDLPINLFGVQVAPGINFLRDDNMNERKDYVTAYSTPKGWILIPSPKP